MKSRSDTTSSIKGTNCDKIRCEERHPRTCRYYKRGNSWRNESCVYLHRVEEKVDDLNVIDEKLGVEKSNDDVDEGMIIDDKNDDTNDMENEIDVGCVQKCSKCQIEEAKNKCEPSPGYAGVSLSLADTELNTSLVA